MGKEAQLVCVRSSFSKRFDIVSTRKLEQYWLYPKAFTRIKELPLVLVRDRGDLGLHINQFDRNVEIKSGTGSSPSLVHFKHSHD